jgi:hypothetical protein
MTSDDRSDKAETGMAPEVANIGIIRPHFVYLGAIALGLLLQFVWPIRLAARAVSVPVGGSAVLVAIALFLHAVRTFRTAGTPVPGNRPTTTIVRRGRIVAAAIPSISLSHCSSSESRFGSTVSGYSSPSCQRWR